MDLISRAEERTLGSTQKRSAVYMFSLWRNQFKNRALLPKLRHKNEGDDEMSDLIRQTKEYADLAVIASNEDCMPVDLVELISRWNRRAE